MSGKNLHLGRMILIVTSFISSNVGYVIVYALFTVLLSELNVGNWIRPIIWLISPIMSLFQPFFGLWNDSLHSKV
jgi:hypothetical protein